jgi:hypothetical protein
MIELPASVHPNPLEPCDQDSVELIRLHMMPPMSRCGRVEAFEVEDVVHMGALPISRYPLMSFSYVDILVMNC